MKIFSVFILVLALLAPVRLVANVEHPTEEEITGIIDVNYKSYRDITVDLMKSCPPAKCYYVGLGRSPTPIVALLQSMSPSNVSSLPLALSHLKPGDLTPALKKQLFEHFDKFLPDLAALGNKELVLVDFVASGDSLIKSTNLLNEYAATKGFSGKISLYAFGHEEGVKTVTNKALLTKTTVYTYSPKSKSATKMQNLLDSFTYQSFDDFSEFPSYQVGKVDPPARVSSDGYKKIREYMNAKALADTHADVVKLKPMVAEAPLGWDNAQSRPKLSVLFTAVSDILCGTKK